MGPRPDEIERVARGLRLDLDRRKFEVWGGSPPYDQLDRIDPVKAAIHLLHAELIESEELSLSGAVSPYQSGNLPSPLCLFVDRTRNKIGLSRRFRLQARRFTLSHGIGHWLLHTGQFVDGPLIAGDRPGSGRQLAEQEANFFAEEFLMPAILVRPYFQRIFQEETLRYHKSSRSLAELLAFGTGLKVTAPDLIAKGREYIALLASEWIPDAGQSWPSLANRFRVSPLAMAIRLQRLELV